MKFMELCDIVHRLIVGGNRTFINEDIENMYNTKNCIMGYN